jgi:hypothetical protein
MPNITTPQIITKTALSAGAFVESIGVNTHLAFSNSAYTNVAEVGSALNYLGVDHVRDGLYTTTSATNAFDALAAAGIKFDFAAPPAADWTVDVTKFVSTLTAYETQFPGSIAAIEGPNEVNFYQINFDGTRSIASGAEVQKEIYTAVKAVASLADIPVYNVTIGSTDTSQFAQLGNLSNYTDYANSHAYVMSTTNISAGLDYLLGFAHISAPDKPVVITETGYTTLTSTWYNGVSEMVQAKYTLDTLMEAYNKGVPQTYLYELFDENFGANNAQSHYGLFNADGTPKPVATAIHNLTAILEDHGGTSANASGTLSYGLSGMPTSGHDMVLAKQDGTMDLVLWAEPVLWSQTNQSAIIAPASSVTVTFGEVEGVVKVYDPLAGSMPIATYFNVNQIQLSASDHPVIIEIDPAQVALSHTVTYSAGVLTGETTKYVAGSADLSDTKVYSAAGVLVRDTIVHADNSKDIYLSAIPNQSYVSEHDTYDSAGVLTAQVRTHQDGSLDSTYTLSADGTKTTNTYDSAGVQKSGVVTHTDGSSDTKTYTGGVLTGETVKYAPGSADLSDVKVFNATGALTLETIVHANGSKDVFQSGVANQSYVSGHDTYNSAGVFTAQTRLHADNSLASTYAVTADGTRTTDTYDAMGVLKSDTVAHTDGSSDAKTYTGTVLTSDTLRYASGAYDTKSYTGTVLTGETVRYAPDSVDRYDIKAFNTSGVLTSDTVVHGDGSQDLYLSAISGRTYVSDHITYSSTGILTAETRLHADNSLAYTYTLAADGTKTANSCDASGNLTSNVVTYADGSSDSKTYAGGVLTGETVRYASGAYDSKTYTGAVLTGEAVKYVPGSADKSDTKVYDSAGVLTSDTVVHMDGSQDLYLSAISGRTYVSEHDTYSSTNILTSQIRLHADNSLAYSYTLAADGTKTSDTYDTSGVLTANVVTLADGTSDSKNYSGSVLIGETLRYASGASDAKTYTGMVLTGETVKYALGSADRYDTKVFNTSGVLTNDTIVHADGSQDLYLSGIVGRSYVAEHDTYSSTGILTAQTRLHADNSLAYNYALASDGTKTADTYDASGVLMSHAVTYVDGSSETKTYAGSVLTGDTVRYASGAYDSKTYTGTILTGEAVKYAPGSADLSDTKVFNTGGILTSDTVVHANGSKDLYLSAIPNQSYVSEHDTYSSSGTMTAQTRLHRDGSLASTYTLASDGTKTTDTYDASSVLKSHLVALADGSSDSKTYTGTVLTGESVKYAAGAADLSDTKVFSTTGALTNETIVHADHSKDVYDWYTGKSYVADHFVYNTAGALQSGDFTNVDSSRTVTAYAAGVTLNSTAGVVDTFNTASAGNDTFNFKVGFGHDVVNGFHASVSHDTLAIDVSEAPDFQHLQLQTVGHDTLITLSSNDSILLKGVAATSLSAQDFHFVHFDLHV